MARDMIKTVEHPTCGEIKLVNSPVKFSFSTPSIRNPPPTLGEHTDEILRDILELDDKEIEILRRDGVVG